jgi:hypothetical protein
MGGKISNLPLCLPFTPFNENTHANLSTSTPKNTPQRRQDGRRYATPGLRLAERFGFPRHRRTANMPLSINNPATSASNCPHPLNSSVHSLSQIANAPNASQSPGNFNLSGRSTAVRGGGYRHSDVGLASFPAALVLGPNGEGPVAFGAVERSLRKEYSIYNKVQNIVSSQRRFTGPPVGESPFAATGRRQTMSASIRPTSRPNKARGGSLLSSDPNSTHNYFPAASNQQSSSRGSLLNCRVHPQCTQRDCRFPIPRQWSPNPVD